MRFLLAATLSLTAALAQPPAATKAKSDVFVVPFSHLDLYWGGTQEECLSRSNKIVSRAVELAQKNPNFRFLFENELNVANYLEANRGVAEVEAFRKLVKAGRIEIAPVWAGIYQNLPRAEALVRNVVYGKRHARENFGLDPQVAHLGDIPGFTRQFPQILAKSHTPYSVMTRMGPPDQSLFHWRAPDGSSVLTWDTLRGYGWGVSLGLHRDLDDARIKKIADDIAGVQATTNSSLYLGWGTDLWAPNQTLVDNLAVLNTKLAPSTFKFGTPTEFFRAASDTKAIPTLAGEIPSSWANIITSNTHIWPPAITAADTLVNAEKFAAINYALGYAPYPQDQLDALWRKALESMDHNNYGQGGDIGDERKVGYAQAAILQGGQILRESLRNIAERVKQPFPVSTPIVVFNPLSWTRDDVVRAHVTLYGDVQPAAIPDYKKAMRLVDEHGAVDLVFTARAVPSLGYKTYYLLPADKAEAFPDAAQLNLDTDKDRQNPRRIVGAHTIENAFYKVTLDRATGRIEIFDKDLNRVVARDLEIAASEERGGNTLAIEPQTGRTIINVVSSVELEENNPVRAVFKISGDLAGVPVTQRLILYGTVKRIDFENTVEWKPGRFLKIEQLFPVQEANAIRIGVPFGSAADSDLMPGAGPRFSDEVPRAIWQGWRQIQDWVSADAADWGVTISADHQFFTVTKDSIRRGMLRGTRFNPLNIVHQGKPVLLQQPPAGTYVYGYSFTSGRGDWAARTAWRSGMQFNTPPLPVEAANDVIAKTLPAERSFLSLDAPDVVVSALKKSDTGNAILLRAFDERGQAAETSVRFLGDETAFRPANMLEEETGQTDLKRLQFKPYEIQTLRIPLR